jgi:CheY-like chemotaxis protein
MTPTMPICFYPMRKIVLDDDHAFTQSMLLTLPERNFISYNSPKEALKYLLNEYQPALTKTGMIAKNSPIADSSTQHIININIDNLKKMLAEPAHQDISVIFVDYHMPDMTGIDFLKAIHHLPIKKALITGENDYKIAVDAFNSGLVDAYLRKDDPHFSDKVQHIVSELEWNYFVELSNLIADIPSFDYLRNIHFVAAFKQFIQENDISAFCLTHTQGNFIAQCSRNKKNYILVRSKMQLHELSKIAEEDGGSHETIENLRMAKMIPFFESKNYWDIPASQWDEFLHPANDLPVDSNLVWTTIRE